MRRCCASLMTAAFGATVAPPVVNERLATFAAGTADRENLIAACKKLREKVHSVPSVIDGQRMDSERKAKREYPGECQKLLCNYWNAVPKQAKMAADSCVKASKYWGTLPFQDRAAVILKAANLIATKYRAECQAATMLGQGKNPWQAEIDCIAETCDFLRFNVKFAEELYNTQPNSPPNGSMWNMVEYRPLEGFVSSITPFNFSAIGANLTITPVLMGNCVVWKPSHSAVFSNYLYYQILEEAGLPPGVINFLPCNHDVMDTVLTHPDLAAVSFTGSTAVFNEVWENVAKHLPGYKNFPRLSGETGGKDYHLMLPGSDFDTVIATTIRSAFEYTGQKCSACSRFYVPKSQWPQVKAKMVEITKQLKVGQPDDFRTFVGPVIDKRSYDKIAKYIETARKEGCEIIAGGKYSMSEGYFIDPTLIVANKPDATTMKEEIFGPVLTIWVYDDTAPDYLESVCKLIDTSTSYALTGSIYTKDRALINKAQKLLRYSAGNFYINDKCTGAVVGMQPFGGARGSGTNDKAGGPGFLNRWVSMRTIKETFDPLPQVSYPHQLPDNIFVKTQ